MKVIRSVDDLVESEQLTSDNEKLSRVLNRRGEREKRFMFNIFGGPKHKDVKEYLQDRDHRLNTHTHTDIARYSESHGCGHEKSYSEKTYNDTSYTERH
ncbi:MAG: hypothetical protein ACMXX9_02310 [Candidatus Woesearchaeota archaeon]